MKKNFHPHLTNFTFRTDPIRYWNRTQACT